jgi:hypothetical protein
MTPLEQGSREERTFDAIVVGSGIAGGWAAKELSEKGLKTLVLERGRQVKHVEDYKTFGMNPWDFRYAGGRTPQDEVEKHYFKQQRTGYTVNDAWNHWFVKDDEHPYTEVSRFDWIRGYHVGGTAISTSKPTPRKASASTGRSVTPTSPLGTTMSNAGSASAERMKVCPNCRTACSNRRSNTTSWRSRSRGRSSPNSPSGGSRWVAPPTSPNLPTSS